MPDRTPAAASPSLLGRVRVAAGLLAGVRIHDFRAPRTYIDRMYTGVSLPVKLLRFAGWALTQLFVAIPEALTTVTFDRPVSKTPIWLAAKNPLANYPWATMPDAGLPEEEVEVAVIGTGFTGGAFAYHWSKHRAGKAVVLEMGEAASGSSGRNQGIVVMGPPLDRKSDRLLRRLRRVRPDLDREQIDRLAFQFDEVYKRACYKNAELTERIIQEEAFDCDYARLGWVNAREGQFQDKLRDSIRYAREAGFDDWTGIEPEEVLRLGGMRVDHLAGFSRGSGTWHPAKWVWALLTKALEAENVELYTNTKVLRVQGRGEGYAVHTQRGTVLARHVLNATESYTGLLHGNYRDLIHPVQSQMAAAEGGPDSMKPHVGMQFLRGGFTRLDGAVIFGGDLTRVPRRMAGGNKPSRFITKYLTGEMHTYFGRSRLRVVREWSCTSGFTEDDFPVIGLLDGKRQYIIGGMGGAGSAVALSAAREVVRRILGQDGTDNYPAPYFAPSRLLDPAHHRWPEIEE